MTQTTISQIKTWLASHTVAELRDIARLDWHVSLGGCTKKAQIVDRLAAYYFGGAGLMATAQAATNNHKRNTYITKAMAS